MTSNSRQEVSTGGDLDGFSLTASGRTNESPGLWLPRHDRSWCGFCGDNIGFLDRGVRWGEFAVPQAGAPDTSPGNLCRRAKPRLAHEEAEAVRPR